MICTCLWLKVNNSERDLPHVTDTQIGLLGGKYSLALVENSTVDAYNLMLTNLTLYLTNVSSQDFFIHFVTSFSVRRHTENVPREISFQREISSNTYVTSYHMNIYPLSKGRLGLLYWGYRFDATHIPLSSIKFRCYFCRCSS